MAGKREADRRRDPEGSGAPELPRDQRVHRRRDSSSPVGAKLPRDDAMPAEDGASHLREVDAPERTGMVVGSGRAPNIFLPTDGKDLSIYKRMIEQGAIRPYQLPREMENLASHLMSMLDMAKASGRMRDAIKCIEVLRLIAADNRSMAMEIDRIDRLDAGRPTAITGQVTPDVQERIKRIVATQRARVLNTEDTHDGTHRIGGQPGHAQRPDVDRESAGGQGPDRGALGPGDHSAASSERGERAPHDGIGETT